MYTLENGKFTVIPVEALSLILEKLEDESYDMKGRPTDVSLEDALNQVRSRVHESVLDYQYTLDAVTKAWKRFNATKEFMDAGELSYHEGRWAGFDVDKFVREKNVTIQSLNRSIFEITDFMLENNITIKAFDGEKDEVKAVSLDDIKNLFDGLGKTE